MSWSLFLSRELVQSAAETVALLNWLAWLSITARVLRHAVLLNLLLLDHVQLVVNITEVVVKHRIGLLLVFVVKVRPHLAVPLLCDDLSLAHVAFTSHFSRLLDTISHDHLLVSDLLVLFAISRHRLHFSDHTHAFVSVERSVVDLCLEWKLRNFSQVEVVELYELFDRLDRVFKCKQVGFCCVSEVFC